MSMQSAVVLVAMGILLAACGAHADTPSGAAASSGSGCSTPDDVMHNPNACLTATARWRDTGFINDYREIYELNVSNRSPFKLSDIAGEVTWVNPDGSTAGTVPFTTKGVVPANGVTLFSYSAGNLSSTKLQTGAQAHQLRFTRAVVAE